MSNFFNLNSRLRYKQELESLRSNALQQLLDEKHTALELTMLKAWRLVVHYTRWVYVNTLHCRSRHQLARWNGDGYADLMTNVVIDQIERLRRRRGVSLVQDDTAPVQKECIPLDLDMFGEYPAPPMNTIDTIDPFPSYYSRSPHVFHVIRHRLPSLPMGEGSLDHAVKTRPGMRVQFGQRLQMFYSCSESVAYRYFDDFLLAVRNGKRTTEDVVAWVNFTPEARVLCAPMPLVRKLPKYLKEWEKRATCLGVHTQTCGPPLLSQ